MVIAVTGSSGRLGRVVVRDLIDHGHDVRPIDLRPAADLESPLTHLADLTRPSDLIPLFQGADAICHLGNLPGINQFPLTTGLSNNVAATHGVFEAAEKAQVKKIVCASSIQAYGIVTSDENTKPMPPQYLPVDEDHPLLPRDAYPLSKAIGEWIAESFQRRRAGLTVFSLRFSYITDKLSANHASPPQIGGSLLTAVHSADAATAVRLCCQLDRPGHKALNIVSPTSTTPWEMSLLTDYYGVTPPLRRPLSSRDALISSDAAREILGFTADRLSKQVACAA
jgi:nucleoside-diphosphate-sugar epimerase